jgi:hypothetical protein
VFVIVAVDLCVAFETHRDGILDAIVVALPTRFNMVSLDLGTAEPVANAAPTVALHKQLVNVLTRESSSHTVPSYLTIETCIGGEKGHKSNYLPIIPIFPSAM